MKMPKTYHYTILMKESLICEATRMGKTICGGNIWIGGLQKGLKNMLTDEEKKFLEMLGVVYPNFDDFYKAFELYTKLLDELIRESEPSTYIKVRDEEHKLWHTVRELIYYKELRTNFDTRIDTGVNKKLDIYNFYLGQFRKARAEWIVSGEENKLKQYYYDAMMECSTWILYYVEGLYKYAGKDKFNGRG